MKETLLRFWLRLHSTLVAEHWPVLLFVTGSWLDHIGCGCKAYKGDWQSRRRLQLCRRQLLSLGNLCHRDQCQMLGLLERRRKLLVNLRVGSMLLHLQCPVSNPPRIRRPLPIVVRRKGARIIHLLWIMIIVMIVVSLSGMVMVKIDGRSIGIGNNGSPRRRKEDPMIPPIQSHQMTEIGSEKRKIDAGDLQVMIHLLLLTVAGAVAHLRRHLRAMANPRTSPRNGPRKWIMRKM